MVVIKLEIKVAGSDIKIVKEETIVVGGKNCFRIKFRFDKKWSQYTNKTAVIYQPSVNRNDPIIQIIGKDNEVVIPTGGMVAGDYLYIGVFGFNSSGTVRLPTIFTYTYVSQGAYDLSTLPIPDNSVYEEIYNMALKAYRKAERAQTDAAYVKRMAEDGEFDGDPGFSPTVTVKKDTSTEYILTITTADGEFDTPNLIAAGTGDLHDQFNQETPSDRWDINHNMKKYPSVTVVDSANTVVYGEVVYDDLNNLHILFSSEFSGKAYLN